MGFLIFKGRHSHFTFKFDMLMLALFVAGERVNELFYAVPTSRVIRVLFSLGCVCVCLVMVMTMYPVKFVNIIGIVLCILLLSWHYAPLSHVNSKKL